MQAMTDDQIIAKCSPSVRGRVHIELQVVNALIAAAQQADYTLHIEDYGPDEMEDYSNDFRTALFDLDEAHVDVCDVTGRKLGWVYIVFGNDGYDCISDYSVRIEEFLKPVNAVADKWGK